MMDVIGNHLWQSTVFAGAAALLTLLFRKNHARIRYALWLSASIKFLVPFSLLISIVHSIDFKRPETAPKTQTAIFYVQEISQPFGSTEIAPSIQSKIPASSTPRIAIFLGVVWACGFFAILMVYLLKRRRVNLLVRQATPLTDRRACAALAVLLEAGGNRQRIRLAATDSSIEPGVSGIVRPVLLLPKGILSRLSDAELDAILAHEITHVQRHDNLTAAVHMLIETVFWFHPIVWWLGIMLVRERETACDETVLRLGKNPQSYAEGILKVCEFCLESPLACVAGVTGSDMKKRIHGIMTHRIGRRLSPVKMLILTTAALASFAVPVVIGLMHVPPGNAQLKLGIKTSLSAASLASPIAKEIWEGPARWAQSELEKKTLPESTAGTEPAGEGQAGAPALQPSPEFKPKPSFDAISIKTDVQCFETFKGVGFSPNPIEFHPDGRFTGCGTVKSFMMTAYTVSQLPNFIGGPEWLDTTMVQIEAHAAGNPGMKQMQLMLQSLLEDKFKLKMHRQVDEVDVYALVVADGGPKLTASKDADGNPIIKFSPPSQEEIRGNFESAKLNNNPKLATTPYAYSVKMDPAWTEFSNGVMNMRGLTISLKKYAGRIVVDKTHISGFYDIKLRFANSKEEQERLTMFRKSRGAANLSESPDPPASPIFTAIEEQLGLKLLPDKASFEFVVIDSVAKPS